VFDISVGEAPSYHTQLIELNPFGPHLSSGAGLFNWRTDRALLFGESLRADGLPHVRVLCRLLDDPATDS